MKNQTSWTGRGELSTEHTLPTRKDPVSLLNLTKMTAVELVQPTYSLER